jgi:hypothetical protein
MTRKQQGRKQKGFERLRARHWGLGVGSISYSGGGLLGADGWTPGDENSILTLTDSTAMEETVIIDCTDDCTLGIKRLMLGLETNMELEEVILGSFGDETNDNATRIGFYCNLNRTGRRF